MSTKYIINNEDSLLPQQIISGDLIITNIISGTTLYGDGSNLTNLPDYYITGGTYYTGGTLVLVRNDGNTCQITGLTNDLNTEIANLAEADGLTLELDINNTVRIKDIVSAPSGGTRTFLGNTHFFGSISATTLYGDGSNLTNLPSGGSSVFTGGTINGETNFTNGLTGNTIYSDNFVGDGSELGGIVGLTYSELGFTITSPTPSSINQNVVLPYNSTVTYPTPLTVGVGYSVTVPSGTTLTII